MQTRYMHYSPNGHDVNVTLMDFTRAGMGFNRKAEEAGASLSVNMMTDAQLIDAYRNDTRSPRKMTKVERAIWEGERGAIVSELLNRGFDLDAVRWG